MNRSQGAVSGGGQVKVTGSPVWGWTKDRRQDHRAMGYGASDAPYLRSPARGRPREANCTRIWWVRPVWSRTRTSVIPSELSTVAKDRRASRALGEGVSAT
nr:MAG TPA: hypothetical protein [Caudoviricetes sp.]